MPFRRLTFLLLAAAASAPPALADSWALPSKETYRSPNGRYQLRVTPTKFESQLAYFEDKVDGRPDAGARKGARDNACRATLSRKGRDGLWIRVWSVPLANEVSPVDALVSDDGRYVVTFDNWHSVGYGDDVVVIYDAKGQATHRFGLEDLLPQSYLERIPTSVSSRWWGGRHAIDEAKGLLVLRIVKPGGRPAFGDDSEDPADFNSMKIDLATGRTVEWSPEPWTVSRFTATRERAAESEAPAEPKRALLDWDDCSALTAFEAVVDLGAGIETRVAKDRVPSYPAMARAAGVSGAVRVQVLVSETGSVLCARAFSGHPLLRQSAVAAAREMTFAPVTEAGTPVKAVGTIALSFGKVDGSASSP